VTQGTSTLARFQYDAEGRLLKKIGEEGIRQYVYDQTSRLAEYDASGAAVARFSYGSDRLISMWHQGEGTRFYHLDGLRSVTALTDTTGAVTANLRLDAWGNFRFPDTDLTASANRFAFTGHVFDAETGLYNAKARYFDPKLGRFLTQDSFLGQIDEPPSLHRYMYANDNPTTFVDPTGFASVNAGRIEDIAPFVEAQAQGYEPRDPATATFASPSQVEAQAKADANKSRRIKMQQDAAEQRLGRLDELGMGGFTHYAEITIEESDFKNGRLDHSKILDAVEAKTGKYAGLEVGGLGDALGQQLAGAQAGDRIDVSELYSLAYNASKARTEATAKAIATSGLGPASAIQNLSAVIGQQGFAPADMVLDARVGLGSLTVDYATVGLAAYQASRAAGHVAGVVGREMFGGSSVAPSPVNASIGSGALLGRARDALSGFRLKAFTRQITREVDTAIAGGDVDRLLSMGASPKEAQWALSGTSDAARFRGTIIDMGVKRRAQEAWGTRGLRFSERFEYGPDAWNPSTMRSWDITTPSQWPAHVRRYVASPPAGRPVWRSLDPLMTR
jgi:RHS repeat-associated protein